MAQGNEKLCKDEDSSTLYIGVEVTVISYSINPIIDIDTSGKVSHTNPSINFEILEVSMLKYGYDYKKYIVYKDGQETFTEDGMRLAENALRKEEWKRDRNRELARQKAEMRDEGREYVPKSVMTFRATNIKIDRFIADAEGILKAFDILNALGLEAEVKLSSSGKTAEVKLVMPAFCGDAERIRTRRAGRRKTRVSPNKKYPEINLDMTWQEFFVWAKDRTADECAEALGWSRSTYYRRLPELRTQIKEEKARNAREAANGESEMWETLRGSYVDELPSSLTNTDIDNETSSNNTKIDNETE